MFGTISRVMIALARSPRATAASTNARTDCSSVAERTRRAISGICTSATAMTSVLAGAGAGHEQEEEEQRGNRRSTSTPRIRSGVDGTAGSRGEPDRAAGEIGEQGRRAGEPEHAAATPEHAREPIAAEQVAAKGNAVGRAANGRPIGARRWGAKDGPTSATSNTKDRSTSPIAPEGGPETEPAHRAAVRSVGTSSTTSRSAIVDADHDERDQEAIDCTALTSRTATESTSSLPSPG